MSEERELVVKDLLVVLGSIDMVNMEPNGDSFVSFPLCLRKVEVSSSTRYSAFPVRHDSILRPYISV